MPEHPEPPDEITVGEIAYNAYRAYCGGKSLQWRVPMPQWHELPIEHRAAWNAAGKAVMGTKSDPERILFAPRKGFGTPDRMSPYDDEETEYVRADIADRWRRRMEAAECQSRS